MRRWLMVGVLAVVAAAVFALPVSMPVGAMPMVGQPMLSSPEGPLAGFGASVAGPLGEIAGLALFGLFQALFVALGGYLVGAPIIEKILVVGALWALVYGLRRSRRNNHGA